MKHWLFAAALICFGGRVQAQQPVADPSCAEHACPAKPPAHSWTYNVDFKDPDALATFVGRELADGVYKAGATWKPASLYRVDEESGQARRWATAGVFLLTSAEKLNASFGPAIGLDVLKWTSQAQITGPLERGANYVWKPLSLASITASVDVFGGVTPIRTPDIKHWWCAGFGITLKGRFGGMQQGNDILKKGL